MRKESVVLGLLIATCLFLSGRAVYQHQINAQQSPLLQSPPPLQPTDTIRPRMQVVFALDATGSMSGLIAAAKEKIWSIASSLTQTDPAPQIEVGLVFYRDKGDEFVTMLLPLSANLDDVYAKLMKIEAKGGGDEPESVNQGLYEAVEKFGWDTSKQTYKTIFLVGDCPPHMDYKNDVKYPQTCLLAKQKDIVLNTILMGNNSQARIVWNAIANCNQGSYTEVGMNANDIVIATPYDEPIATISDQLDKARYYYGTADFKAAGNAKMSKGMEVTAYAKASSKAQRAEYNKSKSGKEVYYGSHELLSDIRDKKVLLDTISESHLPDEMKGLSENEKKVFINNKIQLTDTLEQKLTLLMEERRKYIDNELAKKDSAVVNSSFNSVIYEKIKAQTEKKNIKLKGKAKY